MFGPCFRESPQKKSFVVRREQVQLPFKGLFGNTLQGHIAHCTKLRK
jgi:hypothetical protein